MSVGHKFTQNVRDRPANFHPYFHRSSHRAVSLKDQRKLPHCLNSDFKSRVKPTLGIRTLLYRDRDGVLRCYGYGYGCCSDGRRRQRITRYLRSPLVHSYSV